MLVVVLVGVTVVVVAMSSRLVTVTNVVEVTTGTLTEVVVGVVVTVAAVFSVAYDVVRCTVVLVVVVVDVGMTKQLQAEETMADPRACKAAGRVVLAARLALSRGQSTLRRAMVQVDLTLSWWEHQP